MQVRHPPILSLSLFLSEMDFKLIGGNVNLTLIHHLLNVNWVEHVLLYKADQYTLFHSLSAAFGLPI